MQKSAYVIPDTLLFLDRPLHGRQLMFRDLPPEEKPREKLLAQGPEVLSLSELLALVLQTGTVKEDVLEMSSRIIHGYGEDNILAERDPKQLSESLDIPLLKACAIVAIGELGRRTYDKHESGFTVIRTAKDVYDYLVDLRTQPKECLRGLFLNSRNRVIRNEIISIGTVNANIIHPREVFRTGIEANAAAVILAHNHPSGDATPSAEDVEITRQLVEAGKIVGITVLDHVVITKDAFQSVKADY
ncbi:MAG: DNA repair protein RadC [Candidatus Paceibacterota bacterium]